MDIINKAKENDYWQLAMHCAAVAVGTGCRGGEIRNLQLKDIQLDESKIVVRREIAKNRTQREPRLMALADWGLRNLLLRAQALGATEPEHFLLPLSFRTLIASATGSSLDLSARLRFVARAASAQEPHNSLQGQV